MFDSILLLFLITPSLDPSQTAMSLIDPKDTAKDSFTQQDGFAKEKGISYTTQEIDENSSDEELLAYCIPPDELRSLLRNLDFHIAPVLMIL